MGALFFWGLGWGGRCHVRPRAAPCCPVWPRAAPCCHVRPPQPPGLKPWVMIGRDRSALRAVLESGLKPAALGHLCPKAVGRQRRRCVGPDRSRQSLEGTCPGLQSWVALCASLAAGDDFDFDEGGEGEGLYGEGGTGRRVFGKEGGINLVHGLEVIHGRQKAGGFYDVGVGVAGGLENGANVFHNLPGLLGNAARYELTGSGVKGYLPRNVEKTVGFDGLTVGADGCGSSCGTDDFTHGAFVLN